MQTVSTMERARNLTQKSQKFDIPDQYSGTLDPDFGQDFYQDLSGWCLDLFIF